MVSSSVVEDIRTDATILLWSRALEWVPSRCLLSGSTDDSLAFLIGISRSAEQPLLWPRKNMNLAIRTRTNRKHSVDLKFTLSEIPSITISPPPPHFFTLIFHSSLWDTLVLIQRAREINTLHHKLMLRCSGDRLSKSIMYGPHEGLAGHVAPIWCNVNALVRSFLFKKQW
jgi:hypothetical protein